MSSQAYSLYLNSFAGSPFYQSNAGVSNAPNQVNFTVNWDAVFNLNNHRFKRCRIRHDFYSDNSTAAVQFTPTNQNGVLVLNGINSRSTSMTGGVVLGLITLDTQAVSTPVITGTGSVATGSGNGVFTLLSISSGVIAPGMTITLGVVSMQVLSVISGTGGVGSTYAVSYNVLIAASNFSIPTTTVTYSSLKSGYLPSIVGQDIEVPKGIRDLVVQLWNNNYGASGGFSLLSNATAWGLMLSFEFYDPEEGDKYTL